MEAMKPSRNKLVVTQKLDSQPDQFTSTVEKKRIPSKRGLLGQSEQKQIVRRSMA